MHEFMICAPTSFCSPPWAPHKEQFSPHYSLISL